MTAAANAGVEAIAHAAWMDDTALAAIKCAGTMVNSQLTIIHNFVTFTQPSVTLQVPPIDAPREVAFSHAMWREIYDQKAVAELARSSQLREFAATPSR
jgi:hypothetical protein